VRHLISREQDFENYERLVVEDYVRHITSELCKEPAAQGGFALGDGVWFDNHANARVNIPSAPPADF
jgi:hypothetical protein